MLGTVALSMSKSLGVQRYQILGHLMD